MKKRRYVPHPGHFEGLKELISEAGKGIYSIFMTGSPDYVGAGRSKLSSPQIEDGGGGRSCMCRRSIISDGEEWRLGIILRGDGRSKR